MGKFNGVNPSDIRVIRSSRSTLALEINASGLTVRAPMSITDTQIEMFLVSRQDWIEKHMSKWKKWQEQSGSLPKLTAEEIRELAYKASQYIPERVRYYAPKVGVTYGRVTIRNQRTRWGSCSSKGNLSFNCLLMLTPPQVIDSVVVHELCHRRQMNHSGRFYEEVRRVFPEYDKWNRWLKENGAAVMLRMTGSP